MGTLYACHLQGIYTEHSYLPGVFDSRKKAENAAKLEIRRRQEDPYLAKSLYKTDITHVTVNKPLNSRVPEDWGNIHEEVPDDIFGFDP